MVKVGYALPMSGPDANAENIAIVAKTAEEKGFESLWVFDRTLRPTHPKNDYPGAPGAPWPEPFNHMLDPLEVLSFVAGLTTKVRLGTSVIILGYYNAWMLARRLTTIDVLSNGRLILGGGVGWSEDEHLAAGTEFTSRGKRADEMLEIIKMFWTQDVVSYDGEFFTVPETETKLKPVQQPHPPIVLAAYAPASMQRIAAMGDGWTPVGVPPAGIKEMAEGIKGMAQGTGRDLSNMEIMVRANTKLTAQPLPEDQRFPFVGSLDQLKADYAAYVEAGATEIFFDPSFDPSKNTLDGFLSMMDVVKDITGM